MISLLLVNVKMRRTNTIENLTEKKNLSHIFFIYIFRATSKSEAATHANRLEIGNIEMNFDPSSEMIKSARSSGHNTTLFKNENRMVFTCYASNLMNQLCR